MVLYVNFCVLFGDDVICLFLLLCECDRDDLILYCRDKNLIVVFIVIKVDGLWVFYLGVN